MAFLLTEHIHSMKQDKVYTCRFTKNLTLRQQNSPLFVLVNTSKVQDEMNIPSFRGFWYVPV